VEETQRALLIDDDQTFIDNLRSQLPQCEISETFSRYKTSLIQTERALSKALLATLEKNKLKVPDNHVMGRIVKFCGRSLLIISWLKKHK
jgi:hypothetical protein